MVKFKLIVLHHTLKTWHLNLNKNVVERKTSLIHIAFYCQIIHLKDCKVNPKHAHWTITNWVCISHNSFAFPLWSIKPFFNTKDYHFCALNMLWHLHIAKCVKFYVVHKCQSISLVSLSLNGILEYFFTFQNMFEIWFMCTLSKLYIFLANA